MDAQQAVFDTLTWSRAPLPVSELIYLYWEGSDTEVSGDALAVFADFSKVSNNRGMTNTTRTLSQLTAGDVVFWKGQNRTVRAVVVLSRTTNVYFEDGTERFAVSHTEVELVK